MDVLTIAMCKEKQGVKLKLGTIMQNGTSLIKGGRIEYTVLYVRC